LLWKKLVKDRKKEEKKKTEGKEEKDRKKGKEREKIEDEKTEIVPKLSISLGKRKKRGQGSLTKKTKRLLSIYWIRGVKISTQYPLSSGRERMKHFSKFGTSQNMNFCLSLSLSDVCAFSVTVVS